MPSVSRENAPNVQEMGPSIDRWADLDGYRAEFVEVNEETDLSPLLVGLPNDECQVSHLGYVFKGRLWFKKDGREESYGPGDAFHITPGHTSGADGGSEFLIFAKSHEVAELEQHMAKRAQALHSV